MKKTNIGSVVILVGIGVIGFILFKRKKGSISDKQLADLTIESNALNSGSAGNIDKPFKFDSQTLSNIVRNNTYVVSNIDNMYSNLTPAQIKNLEEAVNKTCPNCGSLDNLGSGQIKLNAQNSSLNQLSNYDFSSVDWSNLDFSNIKIK